MVRKAKQSKKRSRPKVLKNRPRLKRLVVRVKSYELKAFMDAARRDNKTLCEWVRDNLQSAV